MIDVLMLLYMIAFSLMCTVLLAVLVSIVFRLDVLTCRRTHASIDVFCFSSLLKAPFIVTKHYHEVSHSANNYSFTGSRVLPQLQSMVSNEKSNQKKPLDAVGSNVAKVAAREIVKTQSAIPPGLPLPQDFPPLVAPSKPPPPVRKVTQAATSSIKPAVPAFSSSKAQAVITDKEEPFIGPTHQQESTTQSNDVSFDASESGSKVEVPEESATAEQSASELRSEKKSGSANSDETVRAVPLEAVPKAKKANKPKEKRQLPGKLDIASTKASSASEMDLLADSSEVNRSSKTSSQTVNESGNSQPTTPARSTPQSAQSTQINAPRTGQPRTLRVVSTNKADSPAKPAVTSPSPPPESATVASIKSISRRPSLTSVQVPGTPISEKISDNASLTSTSISRANSPPPSKVGTAPVRQTTKSQQKKERRAKQVSKADEASVKAVVEEPAEQAPIIGRKKKTKKINTSRATEDSTPAVTRPSSPAVQEGTTEEKLPSLPATPVQDSKKDQKSTTITTGAEAQAEPDISMATDQPEQRKPPLTAATLLASLIESGQLAPSIENLFKNVPGVNYRFDITPDDFENAPLPEIFTDEQQRAFDAGEAILVDDLRGKPVIILPDGQELRHLTRKEAEHTMSLRKSIVSKPDHIQHKHSDSPSWSMLQLFPPRPAAKTSKIALEEDEDELPNPFIDDMPDAAHQYQGPVSPVLYTNTSMQEPQLKPRIITLEEREADWIKAKKEHEVLEKKMNALIKKNRKLLFGGAH